MPTYKLKYKLWYVHADNAEQAKRKAIEAIRKTPEVLIDVETAKKKERAPLWRLFLIGK